MKNSEKTALILLTRTELKQVKGGGGVDCTTIYQECSPKCGHFSTDYSRFAACVASHTTMCSPLYGWYVICPND